jgi:hypothetical protein
MLNGEHHRGARLFPVDVNEARHLSVQQDSLEYAGRIVGCAASQQAAASQDAPFRQMRAGFEAGRWRPRVGR